MYYYKTNGGIIAVANPIDGEEITAEEFATLKASIKTPVWTDEMQAQYERTRPLTAEEVTAMLIRQQINTLDVDDATALRMIAFYPPWESGKDYTSANGCPVGYKATRNGRLWKLRQEHTSQDSWAPGETGTESLWEEICESNDGTKYDPIPYSGNMALDAGKYYIQSGKTYLCNRDTGNPVYNALSELVGIYVTEV